MGHCFGGGSWSEGRKLRTVLRERTENLQGGAPEQSGETVALIAGLFKGLLFLLCRQGDLRIYFKLWSEGAHERDREQSDPSSRENIDEIVSAVNRS